MGFLLISEEARRRAEREFEREFGARLAEIADERGDLPDPYPNLRKHLAARGHLRLVIDNTRQRTTPCRRSKG